MKPPVNVLVVGFPATKAGQELLPLFLNFSPPGSRITISVAEQPCQHEDENCDDWLPEGYSKEGTLQMLEQQQEGQCGPAIEHVIHYR
jgi:hypothetical protein